MKNNNRKKKNNKQQHIFFYRLLALIFIFITIYTIYNILSSGYFSIFYNILLIIISFIIIKIFNKGLNSKLRIWCKNFISIIVILLIILEISFNIYGDNTLEFLKNIVDDGTRTNTYNIYVLNNSSYSSLNDLNSKELAYLNDEDSTNMLNSINKSINIINIPKDNINNLIEGLIASDYESIIINQSYDSLLSETKSDEYNKLKLIDTIKTRRKIKTKKSNKDITKESFVVYISGEDSNGEISETSRTDVNILLAINPNTHNIAIISTPRDTYVKLKSKNSYDKLTHSGLYGVNESINSLSNLYDIPIDNYIRINFSSFIKVIDDLGGIEVNIPKYFCESDQYRKVLNAICLYPGKQVLNGKEALAYARNRHAFGGGDIARGNHQMEIIKAVISKMTTKSMIQKYNKILSDLDGNIVTDFTSNNIYSFASFEARNMPDWNISTYTIKLKNDGQLMPCYALNNESSYVLIPTDESINHIHDVIKNVLDGNDLNEKNE